VRRQEKNLLAGFVPGFVPQSSNRQSPQNYAVAMTYVIFDITGFRLLRIYLSVAKSNDDGHYTQFNL
jgi:hypothetical protein